MDNFFEFLKNVGPFLISGVSCIAAIISVYVSLKKTPHEVDKTDADAVKSSSDATKSGAEALKIYSDEIARLKIEHAQEIDKLEVNHQAALDKISENVAKLNLEVSALKTAQKKSDEDQEELAEYIKALLRGIERLIGQIKMMEQVPVWEPPQPPNSIQFSKKRSVK